MKKLVISHWLLVIIILIIASFLRLYNITQLPSGLYPDEAMNGNNALEVLSTGDFKIFYPENNGREGLFINIQAFFLKILMSLFGNQLEPWMLRAPSAIFGILTVLGVYFLAKELFQKAPNHKHQITNNNQNFNNQNITKFGIWDLEFGISHNQTIALLSSFLLATSFWHINFSRIGFRAIMAPMFLTWAIYLLLKSLNQVKKKFQLPSTKFQINSNYQNSNLKAFWNLDFGIWILPALAGLVYGLGFYSYIAYRATPLLILIILLLYWFQNKEKLVRKKIILKTLYFMLAAFIVAAPLGLYFLNNPQDFFGRTAQISIFDSPTPLKDLGVNIIKTLGMFNFSGDWNWRHNYAGRPELFWPVGILFIIGIIIGLYFIFTKKSILRTSDVPNINGANLRTSDVPKFKLSFAILFSWLIVVSLPVVISNEGLPHALRAIIMIPPVFILAGIGGVWLYQLATKYKFFTNILIKRITNIFIFIFFLLLVFEAYNTYFILWGRNLNTQGAFAADYAEIGRESRNLPKELPKYVIVEAGGVDVRGIPMPAQTVMFITDTFTPEKQKEKNIFYVLPEETNKIPQNAFVLTIR